MRLHQLLGKSMSHLWQRHLRQGICGEISHFSCFQTRLIFHQPVFSWHPYFTTLKEKLQALSIKFSSIAKKGVFL